MITCQLRGRLGNQMFIIATVIAHALRMNTSYGFPGRSGKRGQFPMMFDHLPSQPDYAIWQDYYEEKEFGVYNPLPEKENLHIKGYFQSEKYFSDFRKEIIEAFNLPKVQLGEGCDLSVAVHVRRGDYVKLSHKHNVITKEWIQRAMQHFSSDYRFVFFSDDIQWCVENFNDNPKCGFNITSDPKLVISAVSQFPHCIMSPSSLSWWGNWIADNKDRQVIVPKNWFAENYTKLKSDDIVPSHWIKL